MQHKNKTEQKYSFGKLTIEISLEGSGVDRPNETIDHMLAAASAVAGVEAVQLGLSGSTTSEAKRPEHFQNSLEFGADIKVGIQIDFALEHHLSNRQLNSMVIGALLPTICETAAIYFGDHQEYTTPQQPLASVGRSENRWVTRQALGIAPQRPSIYDMPEESLSTSRRRQTATN